MSYKHMQPETKLHYRMYKDGKNWVFAAVALAFFGVGAMTTTAHAADVTTTDQAPVEKPASAPASQASSAAASQTSAGSEKASTASEAASVASSAKSDTASNSDAAKNTTNEVESGTTSTASADKSDTKVSDQQSQDSADGSSSVKSDAQSVTSVASQASQSSQSTAQSVTSYNTKDSQASDFVAKDVGSQSTSQVSSSDTSVAKAPNLEFSVDTSSENVASAVDSTNTQSKPKTSVDKTTIAPDGQTVTISPSNFDSFFKVNGDARYADGKVTLTSKGGQSGNITLLNQLNPNYGFTVNGGVSMSLDGQSSNADGISFIFHPGNNNMVGGTGGELGIAGLPNSFGFKIDNYYNGDDTNVHPEFYPDPSRDRSGQRLADDIWYFGTDYKSANDFYNEHIKDITDKKISMNFDGMNEYFREQHAYGAFEYTNSQGVAATYGGPNGTVYPQGFYNDEAVNPANDALDYQALNHRDDTKELGGIYTAAIGDSKIATTDQHAGPKRVLTPSVTNGTTIPIHMVYEPLEIPQKDANGKEILNADGTQAVKTEHIMTVTYGGPSDKLDAAGNPVVGSDGKVVTVPGIQDLTTWSIDVTPWLTKNADGTYAPLSFAMAASTGASYNIQNMNYESFRYVSEAVVNVKYEVLNPDGTKSLISHTAYDNDELVTKDEAKPEGSDSYIPTSFQKSYKVGQSYAIGPVELQGYKLAVDGIPTNVSGTAGVLNDDVIFTYTVSDKDTTQLIPYNATTGKPDGLIAKLPIINLSGVTGQENVMDSGNLDKAPEGYTLVSVNEAANYPAIAEKLGKTGLGYTLQNHADGTVSAEVQLNGSSVPVWYAPLQATATVKLIDATTGKEIDADSNFVNKVVHYNDSISYNEPQNVMAPATDGTSGNTKISYIPVDPNVQTYSINDPKKTSEYVFEAYYVPTPKLTVVTNGQTASTLVSFDNSLKDNDESKSLTPDSAKKIGISTIVESDDRTKDRTIVAYTADQEKADLGTIADNYLLSDKYVAFPQIVADANNKYNLTPETSVTLTAKPVALNISIVSTDGKLNKDHDISVAGGTLLGSYTINLPETVNTSDATYKLEMKDGNTYKLDAETGIVSVTGTYNLNDVVMGDTGLTQMVEVKYIRQSVVTVQDVMTAAVEPGMLLDNQKYAPVQNLLSLIDETGRRLRVPDEMLNDVTVDSKVDLSTPGIYDVTFTPKNGQSVTAKTHVVEIKLNKITLHVGDKWSLADSFAGGTTYDKAEMTVKNVTLVSQPISTKTPASDMPVIVSYSAPYATKAINLDLIDEPVSTDSVANDAPLVDSRTRSVYAETFVNVIPRQATTPETPVTTPEKPATTPEKPATTPEKPATTPEKPATTPEKPATTPEKPATTPEKPATTPEKPATIPEKPATTPETPVTTPEKPATTPETPVTTPEKPVTTTEVPVTTPEKPVNVAETPTPVDQPTTPAQTPDVPAEPTTPTEPAQPVTVANVTSNVPTQPVLTPTATAQPTTPVSSDRPWDPIELLMTDDDNGQIITTTEIQGYTGNWVYIGNMVPAGYHLAPGQSDWILLNDVTPQTVHLVADAVDQTSTAATRTTVAPAATTQTLAPVAQQSVPATVVKKATAPTTKTTDETDQPAAAELPHTGELATTAAMGTGLALLTGLLSLFGLRRKQH
ncbi:lectin-like domain-containing protein [Furfurilactobacillus milii]|uniref:KxYKxGKxW signal peptide domain-containing protein n=1 Tax=Furfurilactobacillus milii TaxID=2888272 RepID=A0ABT6DCX0_9LACO|nr:KxYKxGKxW signal peptide domain-containing protein [Furfurilactobacillus milii]MCF6160541.1 KxYKxGKxW signal peptide domain-containing protein [Furfurilactobacillus milii]MCF6162773.1 KxYKxGKxW signal peptide domain-containing protein [Furfurilactobacillus milii]MDF9914590.1 KxYKxGKxW signal peptide domain-containing protein [Furfurilactobacillus milii]